MTCDYCTDGRCNWLCETAVLNARSPEPISFAEAMKIMDAEQRMLTKPGQVCYTITSGMSLKDFKRDAINAYYNRDAETLNRLLDSLGPV